MSMDCKTCKGTGRIEFERGAVVKNCPHCKGTGSAKFIALCDALITPVIKERNEARAERDALRAQVEAMRAALEDAAKGILWLQASVPMSLRISKRASKDYNAAKRAALQAKP